MKHFITLLMIASTVLTTEAQTSIQNPAPGEWPNFKRDIRHTGTVLKSEMTGRITAASKYVKWSVQIDTNNVEHFTGPIIVQLSDGFNYVVAASGKPGIVKCINGSTGAVLWTTVVPDSNQYGAPDDVRPLGLIAEDIDNDGKKELLFTANNSNHVYCIRLENEGGIDTAGSIQWIFTFPSYWEISEGTPTAVNIDGDSALEVIVGTDYSAAAEGARVYAIDGSTGLQNGNPFIGEQRQVIDTGCTRINKMDSGCPAVTFINGQPIIYIGAWDGNFYALEWRTFPSDGLYAKWTHSISPDTNYQCIVGKVRSSAAIGQIIPGGDEELVFGFMYEGDNEFISYSTTPELRILDAHGLAVIQTIPTVRDWKSTPSIADIDTMIPGLEIEGGTTLGIYKAEHLGPDSLPYQETLLTIPSSEPGGFRSSPAIGDIDNDGEYELIIGIEHNNDSVGLIVFDAKTLTEKWNWYDTIGNPLYNGVVSAPAVGDIDNDGWLEIVFLSTDGRLYAIDGDAPVGIAENHLNPIHIYPNPAIDNFTVSFSEKWKMENAELKIFDLTGRVVNEQMLNRKPASSAGWQETINCKLNAGIYFVKVSDGEKIYTQKLIIQ